MSVVIGGDGTARLVLPSRVDDAEPLWRFLLDRRRQNAVATVDLSGSGPVHAAVLQLLLAFEPVINGGEQDDPFALRLLADHAARQRGQASPRR